MIKLIGYALGFLLLLNSAGHKAESYTATAYCLKGKTASGQRPSRGMVAIGNHVKLGTRVYLQAGDYTGVYIVTDRGVHGKHVDIWVQNRKEAIRFGKRKVDLTILK